MIKQISYIHNKCVYVILPKYFKMVAKTVQLIKVSVKYEKST